MAQRVRVLFIDDVDGGEAEETVGFALDGVSYEIDVSAENAEALRESIAPWIGHARRVGGRSKAKPTAAPNVDLGDVRAWARENGFTVSDRGRLANNVINAYKDRDKAAPKKPARRKRKS